MSMSINTNTAAMSALQVLNQTTDQLSKTQNAVSTGKSVSSASDSPAIYAISQTMNSQISALSGVSTGLQFAGQVVSTASKQSSSISDVLSSMSETVTNAANNGEDQDTLNTQLSSYLSQIDVATSNSTFQGVNLLSGSTSSSVKYTQVSAAQDINGNLFTLKGADATSTGLGLEGLSTDMKGATVALGSTSLSASGSTATTLQLQNNSATGNSGTAANPAVTTQFILDANPGSTTGSSSASIANALNSALTSALPTLPAGTASVGTDGSISISSTAYTSKSSSADGSVSYSFGSGTSAVSLTIGKDASGNKTYSVGSAPDANGNSTSYTNIVDVNVSKSATSAGTITDSTAATSTLMSAVSNAGFGISRDSDNTLTIAGGNLDASNGIQFGSMSTTGVDSTVQSAKLDLSSSVFKGQDATVVSASVGGVSNLFVMDAAPGDTTNGALDAVQGALTNVLKAAGSSATAVAIAADGSLTVPGDTVGTPTTSNGATVYTTSSGLTITASTDKDGNNTYAVSKDGYAKGTVIDVATAGTDKDAASSVANAMTNAGITATVSGTDLSISNLTTNNLASETVGADGAATAGTASTAVAGSTVKTGTTSGTSVVQLAVGAAITKMSRIASSIGVASTTLTQLQTSNSNLSDALTTGVGALTDADLAAESAKLTSLQTKQQLAIQSLSIANSQSSNIMSLFRG